MSLECSITVSNSNFTSYLTKMDDRHYQKKFQRMRQQHEIDKQVLMAQFQYQTSSLHQQHQHQLQEHFKMVLTQQHEQQGVCQISAGEKANELIHSVKNKEKKKESAVASNAVKQHLQKFVIRRQNVKNLDNYSAGLVERSTGLPWTSLLDDDHEVSSQFHSAMHDKYDFPLRKTASEPNLKVKSRLKQKLSMDQRSSPWLARRHDVKADLANRIKKKMNPELVLDSAMNVSSNDISSNSAPNSSPNSPPSGIVDVPLSALPRAEVEFYNRKLCKSSGTSSSRDLYTSPSLPNISFGMSQKNHDKKTYAPGESEVNRIVSRTSSLPGPLMQLSSKRDLPSSPPDHPNEFEFDSKITSIRGHQLISQQHPLLNLDSASRKTTSPPGPIRPSHLNRPHKTLIRTHSAPTTATSQLQQHILQRKQNRLFQQQQQQQLQQQKMLYKYGLLVPSEAISKSLPHQDNNKSDIVLDHLQSVPSSMMTKEHKSNDKQLFSGIRLAHNSSMKAASAPHKDEQSEMSGIFEPTFPTKAFMVPRMQQPPHRPLLRTKSSPPTSFIKKSPVHKKYRHTTGIAYSPVMLRHGCACGDDHTEHAGRLRAIWDRLKKSGLVTDDPNTNCMCELLEARKATTDELQLVHTEEHTLRYGTTSLARKKLDLNSKFIVLPCGGVGVDNGIDIDTVWNELETMNAARMAVGLTVDLSLLVAEDELTNGFALVRPPGHHAEKNLAMAFCFFNSVAVATQKLKTTSSAKRILIIDWDIYHCNGTQNIFYNDPSVLVISIHRYDNGCFFPGTGSVDEVGADNGVGYNVNIGFSGGLNPPMGDAEYLAVFRTLVLPISQQFNPDIILISSGFSAASGHSPTLGGYNVSPQCFGYLTNLLLSLANGKIVMVLEGGFELGALCDCTEKCIRTLLGEKESFILSDSILAKKPHVNAVKTIENVINIQGKHWMGLEHSLASMTHAEWISTARENETCEALALLTVKSNSKYCVENESGDQAVDLTSNVKANELSLHGGSIDDEELIIDESQDVSMSAESSPLDVVGTPPDTSHDDDDISNDYDIA